MDAAVFAFHFACTHRNEGTLGPVPPFQACILDEYVMTEVFALHIFTSMFAWIFRESPFGGSDRLLMYRLILSASVFFPERPKLSSKAR